MIGGDSVETYQHAPNCRDASETLGQSASSSSSSSCSPPYLSPDSISLDSSTCSKYFSESSLDSPSAVSCSLPVSSTLSNFSNLSLVSSRTSSHPKSNSSEIGSVNIISQPYSQAASSPLKKVSPSLAERRGSSSKSLKLSVMSDTIRETNDRSCFLTKQDEVQINNNSSSSCESDIEIVLESKRDVKNGGDILIQGSSLKISSSRLANADSHDMDCTLVNSPPQVGLVSTVPTRMEGSVPEFPDVLQPLA